MCADLDETNQARRYLLGELSPEERSRVQQRLFEDDEFYRRILVCEQDLMDAYVRGSLSRRERSLFEQHCLVGEEQRRKLEFARGLQLELSKAVAERKSKSDSRKDHAGLQWSVLGFSLSRLRLAIATTAACLVLAGLAWWIGLVQVQNPRTETGNGRLGQPTLFLATGMLRGENEIPKISLGKAFRRVLLQLQLPEEANYAGYSVSLTNPEGKLVLSVNGLEATTAEGVPAVDISIPSGLLTVGHFEVALEGLPTSAEPVPLDYYYFDVVNPR